MTWFRVGGGSGIPASLKSRMNAVLNKKFGSSIDYPANEWPDNVDLLGLLEEKTASGSIVTFTDGADDVPLKSCEVSLPASLDGYSSVDVVSAGKNLFDKDNPNEVDGYFTTTGFSTGNANAKTIYIPILGGATYTVSKTAGQRFQIATAEVMPSNGAVFTGRQADNTSTSLSITASANDKYLWAWIFLDGTDTGTLSEMLASVMIEVGSTATTYEPYVTPTTHTASLGRTIYGGTADVVKGEGAETCTRIKISDLNWTYYTGGTNPIFYAINIPNMKIYERGDIPSIVIDGYTTRTAHSRSYLSANMANMECSAIENAQTITFRNDTYTSVSDMIEDIGNEYIVYELATPTDFTFSPVEINSLLGSNTLWSEQGDTSVVYRSSGTVTPIVPTLISKTITANGTYTAEDDGADGYDEVVVNVSTSVSADPIMSLNAFVTKSGVSGTDASTVARSFTMSAAGKLVFASGTYGFTNTGSNEGYFEIQKNGVSVVKQYCNTSTNTPITIPNISVEENDVVDLVVGFDNSHSNCNYQFYSAMVVLLEV